MKAGNKLLTALVALASVAAGIYVANHQSEKIAQEVLKKQSTDPVQALFATQLPDADGRMQALAQWRGKPLVLNFWASWCPPCVEEMPELSKLQQNYAVRGIQVIGIAVEPASGVVEFNKKYKISYPLLVGGIEGNELAKALGNKAGALPYTVLIDSDGKIKRTYSGILKFDQFYFDLQSLFTPK